MKNKYNDNRLAEEFDLIILTNDTLKPQGLPLGSLGTLTYSYTGMDKPLYAEFAVADGSHVERELSLQDFRVLNVKNDSDLSIVTAYLRGQYMQKKRDLSRFLNAHA